jgi:hypothetical protein
VGRKAIGPIESLDFQPSDFQLSNHQAVRFFRHQTIKPSAIRPIKPCKPRKN